MKGGGGGGTCCNWTMVEEVEMYVIIREKVPHRLALSYSLHLQNGKVKITYDSRTVKP